MSDTKTVLENRIIGGARNSVRPRSFRRPTVHRRQRRGAMMVLCAVSVVVLLAIAALIVDGAWVSVIRTEAQVASDLATRSTLTAYMLDRTDDQFDQRKRRAQRIGEHVFEQSHIGQTSVDIDSSDVKLGLQTVDGGFDESKNFANAALIDLPQVDDKGFGLILAPIFGHDFFNTSARSKAAFRPLDVVLCVDMSRSMVFLPGAEEVPPPNGSLHEPVVAGSRWLTAVESVNSFLDKAKQDVPAIRAGLVSFGGGVHHIVDTPWDDNAARTMTDIAPLARVNGNIRANLNDISTHPLGWTSQILEGLGKSYNLLQAQSSPEVQRVIILLTDGSTAEGEALALPVAEAIGEEGVIIHTVYFSPQPGTKASVAALSEAANGLALTPNSKEELDEALDYILATLSVRMVE